MPRTSAIMAPMKTIGFISDTHGTLDPAAYAALADSDVIIHAGDIGRPSVLTELRCLAPTISVLGNNVLQYDLGLMMLEVADPQFEYKYANDGNTLINALENGSMKKPVYRYSVDKKD